MIDAEDEEFKRVERKLAFAEQAKAFKSWTRNVVDPTFGDLLDLIGIRFEDFLVLREALDLVGVEDVTDDEYALAAEAREICDRVLDLDNNPILTGNPTGGTIESSSTTQ